MKARFYIDIMPGQDLKSLHARMLDDQALLPLHEEWGERRIAFDVEIPDHILKPVSVVLPESVEAVELKS